MWSSTEISVWTQPIFFVIFINDLPYMSNKIKIYIFADDTNIYVECENISKVVQIMNKELKVIKTLIDANLLSLNISKTNYIIFHSPVMPIPSDIFIKICREHINGFNYVQFLRLLLDEDLRWNFHLSELTKKLARTCGILFKIRDLLPTNTLINVCYSLFIFSYNMALL